jgi:hypothetical protein
VLALEPQLSKRAHLSGRSSAKPAPRHAYETASTPGLPHLRQVGHGHRQALVDRPSPPGLSAQAPAMATQNWCTGGATGVADGAWEHGLALRQVLREGMRKLGPADLGHSTVRRCRGEPRPRPTHTAICPLLRLHGETEPRSVEPDRPSSQQGVSRRRRMRATGVQREHGRHPLPPRKRGDHSRKAPG